VASKKREMEVTGEKSMRKGVGREGKREASDSTVFRGKEVNKRRRNCGLRIDQKKGCWTVILKEGGRKINSIVEKRKEKSDQDEGRWKIEGKELGAW